MTHREKSLTPWILPDGFVPTFLSPSVYDAAAAQGCDMKWFVRQEPIPRSERFPGIPGSLTPDPAHTTRRGNPKKHRDDRGCSGMCMLGLGGKCVACSEDDMT
jgi:hypothetical protein